MIIRKDKSTKNYKFDSLNVFAWDRALDNKKKFRKVYESNELTYVSVELSIFNKLFDEEDWEAEITLIANKLVDGEEPIKLCEKTKTVKVSKEDNIFKYSFGWGDDKRGSFWKQGTYEWEAYIHDEFVATARFYVEEEGKFKTDNKNYLTVHSFDTYKASDISEDKGDNVFLRSFDVNTTQYILGELKIINLVSHAWHCELFFNIYDDTGMPIGSSNSIVIVEPDAGTGEIFSVTGGWGPESGRWIEDNYTMEVTFMDEVIAIIPFSVGDKDVERISEYEALLNEDVGSIYGNSIDIKDSKGNKDDDRLETEKTISGEEDPSEVLVDNKSVEEILAELNALIGLENIKKKVREYVDFVGFLQLRKKAGIKDDDEIVLHSVFTGNPGTGKTTVVKLLGEIYRSMGLLSKGHVHTVEASDIVAGFIRQTGKDTKKAIEKARGGILFIDEAYMLFKEGNTGNDFGSEAVAALITEMSDGKGDIAIMVAGYPKEMESFLNSNPGLKSRFRNYFHFEDYTPDELSGIAEFAANKKGVEISKGAEKQLKKVLTDTFRKRDRTFGNARFAFALIDEAKMNLAARIMKDPKVGQLSISQLSTLNAEDIEDVSNPNVEKKLHLEIDETLLKQALDELGALTGLATIKQEVRELVKLCRYYKKNNRDVLKAFSIHIVFTGNPGTGKTTIARKLGEVFKTIGVIKRGQVVEVDRSKLVGQYTGQTPKLVDEACQRAMGGILFVDEAYTLAPASGGQVDKYGQEAIETLMKRMEDDRGKFVMIAAGYKDEMEGFLNANPGMKSRFDRYLHINDYQPDELYEIFKIFVKKKKYILHPDAEAAVRTAIEKIYKNRDKNFANAREMRKLFDNSLSAMSSRITDVGAANLSDEDYQTILAEDIPSYGAEEQSQTPDYLKALDCLVGLDDAKEKIAQIAKTYEMNRMRMEKFGVKASGFNTHLVFFGDKGSGKSSLALSLKDVFIATKALSRPTLTEINTESLLNSLGGQYQMQLMRQMEQTRGGILFLDHFDTLLSADDEVRENIINALLQKIVSPDFEFCLIIGGNKEKLLTLLDASPSLKSRFAQMLELTEYESEALANIFKNYCTKNNFTLSGDMDEALIQYFDTHKDNGAHEAKRLFEHMLQRQSIRLSPLFGSPEFKEDMLNELRLEDLA